MDQVVMRYFWVSDSLFIHKVDALIKERAKIADKWAQFAKDHGALTAHTWQHSGEFAGFTFDHEPPLDTYKPVRDLWVPMKSKPKGKKVLQQAQKLLKPVSPNDVLNDYGIDWKQPVDGMYACVVGFVGKGGWFVKVPSRHSSELVTQAWQPPAAWLELSEWAFLDKFHAQSQS